VSCFALAVNEENAAFGRVVTAPTNGAAGVIPAVLMYAICFCDITEAAVEDFVLMAAEIAMEHHLGLTCDPVGGLVQVPCIERNTMGAIKAITACNIALSSDPRNAKVTLDAVIRSMWATAQDMNTKYKETSEGGLAVQIPVNLPEC
jgi:L-serine dehydratase